MAIIHSGLADDGMWEVDPTSDAVLCSVRGCEAIGGGYYRASLNSGTITARAAGDILYAFQNPSTSPILSVILGVSIGFRGIAGGATSSSFVSSLYFTRSYSVLDTTGALAAVSFKGQLLTQTRSSQANSIYRITSTTAMTGGTGTDDSHPLASLVFTHPGIVTTLNGYPFFSPTMGGLALPQHPIVLAPGEGVRIRTDQAWTTGNTAVACVDVEWLECVSY
jgi:hypothetical protein